MNPEQLLTRDALMHGAITHKNSDEQESHQLNVLVNQLRDLVKMEAIK